MLMFLLNSSLPEDEPHSFPPLCSIDLYASPAPPSLRPVKDSKHRPESNAQHELCGHLNKQRLHIGLPQLAKLRKSLNSHATIRSKQQVTVMNVQP